MLALNGRVIGASSAAAAELTVLAQWQMGPWSRQGGGDPVMELG